jgi:hypothetical protein
MLQFIKLFMELVMSLFMLLVMLRYGAIHAVGHNAAAVADVIINIALFTHFSNHTYDLSK